MSLAPLSSSEPNWNVEDSLHRVIDAVRSQTTRIKELSDGSYQISCINPGHGEDRNPSLNIRHATTQYGGRTFFRCFACGESPAQEDWASWAGLEYDDLFDDRRWELHHRSKAERGQTRPRKQASGPQPSFGRLGPLPKRIVEELPQLLGQPLPAVRAEAAADEHTHRWEKVETYLYRRADTTPVQRVVRRRCTDQDCSAKNFPQSYLTRGGDHTNERDWVDSKAGAGWGSAWEPALYRHPQVLAAVEAGEPIWVLEGEKDVHFAEENGLVATTNPGGAGAFPEVLASALAGAGEINVVLDRDRAGWARGVRLVELMDKAGGARPRLWLPATTEPKSDFTDHLQAGHTVADLIPAPVAAVTAWHLLTSKVDAAATTIEICRAEADAQLAVAGYDRSHGRKAKAEERGRFAVRWAKEALRQHARLAAESHALVDQVAAVPVHDTTHGWALEALEAAQTRLRTSTLVVHIIGEQTQVPVPPAVDEVRLSLPATAPTPDPTAQPTPDPEHRPDLQVIRGGGGGDETPGVVIEHDVYQIIGGEVVQVRWVRTGDSQRKTYKRIVNAPLLVHAREMSESEEDISADVIDLAALGDRDGRDAVKRVRNLTELTHVVLEIPGIGEEDPPRMVRIPFDDWGTGAFLAHLPITGLDYNGGRSGREKVVTAINHVSDPQIRTSYRATGWRLGADGAATYITAAGAITKDGWSPVPTNLSGPLARFDLPNPVQDADRIREAFLAGSAPFLDRFPDRVGAVLVGQAFRAALCPNEWPTVLSASPAVGKTGLAALAMHYFGEMWDRMRPVSSMSGNGATMNALRIMSHQAKDAVLFLDDNAPTAGVEQAWKRLEETVRMIHNQEGRARAERTGLGTLPEMRPRTSAIITTELPPRAGTSGERRALIVPLTRRDVDVADIIAMDDIGSRHRRALLMSSYLQWLAKDYRGNVLRAARLRDEFVTEIEGDIDAKALTDHGIKVAELAAGWGLLLEYLEELGALTPQECQTWRDRVREALIVTAEAAHDPDLVETTGQRAAELLRFALTNGLAYAADADNGRAPLGYERRMGYRPVSGSSYGTDGASEWRTDPRAISLGHVQTHPEGPETGPELLCDRAGLEAVIKAAAAAMPDTSNIDLGTVLRAFEDEGVLKVRIEHRRGGIVVRRTLDRTIRCVRSMADNTKPLREKRIVLRLSELFGEAGPEQHPPTPAGDPSPQPPPATPHALPLIPAAPSPTPTPSAAAPQRSRSQEDPVDHTTDGGLTAPSVNVPDHAPCGWCGRRCGITFADVRLHVPCFEQSSARTIQQLREQFPTAATPTAPPAPTVQTRTTPHPVPAASPVQARRQTRRTPDPAGFRFAAVVVDVDVVHLPDGTTEPLPFPITHFGDLEELGRSMRIGHAPLGSWKTHPQAGTLVLTAALWKQLGVDLDAWPARSSKRAEWLAEISEGLPSIQQAVQAGWVFGTGEGDPVLKMSTKLRRGDVARGSIKIAITRGLDESWGLGDDVPPAAIARRLHLFATTFGVPFGGSPINAALDAFEALTTKATRDALKPVDWGDVPPAQMHQLERHFNFTRTPMEAEQDADRVVFFDRGQSYLAGWSSIRFGLGAPHHLQGPVTFDEKCAGWWRITLPENTLDGVRQSRLYPDLLDPGGTQGGREVWVTTPALAYAKKNLDVEVEIHQAWVWPEERSKRILEPLYKQIRSALAALRAIGDDDARCATFLVKAVYKHLSGYFISDNAANAKSVVHQPYWFHAMIAQARVGILHQVLTIGTSNSLHGRANVWPVVVSNTDLVGYLTDATDNAAAWPGSPDKLGFTPGAYKPAREATLRDQLPFLNGKGWGGLDATSVTGEGS